MSAILLFILGIITGIVLTIMTIGLAMWYFLTKVENDLDKDIVYKTRSFDKQN